MIPKIIHYCWLSNDAYPEKIKVCIDSWKKNLPDYEFILWDKSKFDINSHLWVKQAYEVGKYAFAADYIRLYALYNYGGIYLDSDVEVLKSFNPLLNQPYFFCTEDATKLCIEAATIGAEPHNEYIGRCLSYYQDRMFIVNGVMDMLPLPQIMSSYVDKYKIIEKESDFCANLEELQIYTKEYFSPKDGNTGNPSYLTNKTYSIHHYAGSWVSNSYKFKQFLLYKILGKQLTNYCVRIKKHILNRK